MNDCSCEYTSACVHMCVFVCVPGLRLSTGIFFDFTSTLFFDAGAPSNPELANMASLSRQLALGLLAFTPRLEL